VDRRWLGIIAIVYENYKFTMYTNVKKYVSLLRALADSTDSICVSRTTEWDVPEARNIVHQVKNWYVDNQSCSATLQ
jgi:hypothetical protein